MFVQSTLDKTIGLRLKKESDRGVVVTVTRWQSFKAYFLKNFHFILRAVIFMKLLSTYYNKSHIAYIREQKQCIGSCPALELS